jgi:glutaredoxin
MDLDDLLKEYWPIVVGVVVVLLTAVVLWPSGEIPVEVPPGPVVVSRVTDETKQALLLKHNKEETTPPVESPAPKVPEGEQTKLEYLEIVEAFPVEGREIPGRKYTTDDPEVQRALGQVQVTIYQEKECASCSEARAYFSQNGVGLTTLDVDEDANLRERVRRLSGSRSLPVLVVDGKILQGFSESAVNAALTSAVKSRVEGAIGSKASR